MKFYSATTTAPLELTSVFGEGTHVFPAGTTVSATEGARANRWHLNAEHACETYDGFTGSESLTIGAVLATVNE
jgi:hypothetical protein